MFNHFRLAALALLVAGATVAGCHHDTDVAPASPTGHSTTPPVDSTSVVGRWELTKTEGGIFGKTTPADPAQKHEIVFDSNGQATFLLNGTANCIPNYTVAKDSTWYGSGGQKVDVITLSNYSCHTGLGRRMLLFQFSATKMTLVDEGSDEFYYYYVRRKF